MSKINLGRVILGGLVAGLIANLLEFVLHEKVIKADEMAAMTASHPARTGPGLHSGGRVQIFVPEAPPARLQIFLRERPGCRPIQANEAQ